MPDVKTDAIRNVVLVGHTHGGKTQIAEAMLHKAGVTTRMGSSDEGNTLSDFEPEEKERQGSVLASVLHFGWKNRHVNLIDTPGYGDFIGQVISGLAATDIAVLVVSAAVGPDIHSRRYFRMAGERGMARVVVVNKADAENVDLVALYEQIQEALGSQCRLVTAPVGQGPSFSGVVDVFAQESGDALMDVASAHGEVVESIIEADETLMERYLGEEEITPEELAGAYVKALVEGTLVPVLYTSARGELGVEELMDLLVQYAPSPAQAKAIAVRTGPGEDAETVEVGGDPAGPLCAQVFKVVSDPYVGRISYLRVWSGTLEADSSARIGDDRRDTRFAQLLRIQGKESEPLAKAVAGDVVGVPKMEELGVGTSVCTEETRLVPEAAFPVPMFSLALSPKSRGDEQKLSEALAKLVDEDPTLTTSRDRQTHELVLNGIGDIHLTVALARLKRRFQVDVDTKPPKIPYRETIMGKGEGHYRHKKQTGGAGQFGEVYLRVEPMERGEGFEFVDDIFGGAIPKPFLPAIEKGIREAMEEGVIAGYPFQDVRVSVYDGKHHPVDSKEIAFKIAGRNAFRDAVDKAKPTLLERFVDLAVTVPDQFLGDITGDLNSRRGRIQGMEAGAGGTQTIQAQVPLAEVTQYNTQLRSITGGQGAYTMEFSHYEPVPGNVQQQIIDAAAKAKEEED